MWGRERPCDWQGEKNPNRRKEDLILQASAQGNVSQKGKYFTIQSQRERKISPTTKPLLFRREKNEEGERGCFCSSGLLQERGEAFLGITRASMPHRMEKRISCHKIRRVTMESRWPVRRGEGKNKMPIGLREKRGGASIPTRGT